MRSNLEARKCEVEAEAKTYEARFDVKKYIQQ